MSTKKELAAAFGRNLAYQSTMNEREARDALHAFAATLHPHAAGDTPEANERVYQAYRAAYRTAEAAYIKARPAACATFRGLAHWADAR